MWLRDEEDEGKERGRKKGKKKRYIGVVDHLPVYPGNKVHFRHFVESRIGATWTTVRDSLYENHYTALEVNAYRNGLLDEFWKLCKEHGLNGQI